ncbi:hypothetical protein [Paraburkholderia guartelaensis]|uniref:hypothetical protein n=1 Tax=Paraburkholderia guartelaensis TaxID=2546446 RepID=UPI002AB6A6DC|nr:hypothetical protein [Paraburkholderia guartelaensis]
MDWSIDDFKATSMEVGQWCWGTLQGAFNEKQTISQVIVDAVVGMIPLIGDVTAVRDLLAVGIDMSKDPKKREEVMQWVLLAVLVFALIPVVGGVIKGVGRLALRVTGDAAKDAELFKEVIQFLNRMGHGDAPKWLKALDITAYQSQLLSKLKDFCATVCLAIERSLKARVGQLLPVKWRTQLERVGDGFRAIQDVADQMVPKAIKELDAKLKTLQNMVYRGEIHEIATGGMPRVKRESEAYLEERKLAREIRQGKFASTQCAVDDAWIKSRYQPKIDAGWPDILAEVSADVPAFKGEQVYTKLATFHGELAALDADQLAGQTLYRAFGNPSKHAPWGSKAGGRQPAFWGIGSVPKSAEEWRIRAAVLDEWNGNGFIAVAHLPDDFGTRVPTAKAWVGQIAEQFGNKIPAQYLEGGGRQLVVDLGALATEITRIGESVKASGTAITETINGVRVDFYPTNWTNVEDVYGYSRFSEDVSRSARTRRLASDEIQTKVANSKTLAASRTAASGRE